MTFIFKYPRGNKLRGTLQIIKIESFNISDLILSHFKPKGHKLVWEINIKYGNTEIIYIITNIAFLIPTYILYTYWL